MPHQKLKRTQYMLGIFPSILILGVLFLVQDSGLEIGMILSLTIILLPLNLILFYKIRNEQVITRKVLVVQYTVLAVFIAITVFALM